MTDEVGVPEIVGGLFGIGAAATVMLKEGSDAVAVPSLTRIVMLLYTPTWLALGVPLKRPVVLLNVVQDGRLVIMKVSALPSASLADGVNA
jgi:hypothetical protein